MRVVCLLCVAVCLTGCSVLDCTDLKRINNCFLFGGDTINKAHINDMNAQFYKSYKPQKISVPAKTWGKK